MGAQKIRTLGADSKMSTFVFVINNFKKYNLCYLFFSTYSFFFFFFCSTWVLSCQAAGAILKAR